MKDRAAFGDLDIVSLYFDTYTDELGIVRNKFDDWVEENKSSVLKELNLKDEDFRLDNKDKLDKRLYQAALFNVVIEVRQSVEAMYHNLNSLQSRSGKFYCPVL
jgi:ribonucleoside-triphosphate reductase